MMRTYADFLQEKIITEDHIEGSFIEKEGKVYIISDALKDGFQIPFPMLFKEEYYDGLLEAARELLFIYTNML